MNVYGQRVLVIGAGESGLAMARWLSRQGARLRVADSRENPPNAAALAELTPAPETAFGPWRSETFDGLDLMAISPGVPVETPAVQAAARRGIPLVSEIELFAWGARSLAPASSLLAITGSNGKTTTTALTAHLLNSIGMTAFACGNISPSALDALMAAQDAGRFPRVWVLELSSFQLETTRSLNAEAATLLNVSEDHLDRHGDMRTYLAAKARVFQGEGVIVVNRDDPASVVCALPGRKIVSFGLNTPPAPEDYGLAGEWICRGEEKLIAADSLRLVGRHNAANAMAALALCEAVGARPRELLPALARFTGLIHRVQWVAGIQGVDYYDDSKGTNVGATLAAVQGLGRPVAVILGGEGKEQDFSPLSPVLAAHGRAVALIGRDAPRIAEAIAGCGVPTQFFPDLEGAVRWCAAQTQAGDAVLLSPACASFDMFRHYGHRAEAFVGIVRTLEAEAA